jgi:fibronectin-binding autotransporter adhesin
LYRSSLKLLLRLLNSQECKMKSIITHSINAILIATILSVFTTTTFGAPPVLRWNGSSGDTWDATTTNWLDAGSASVAWRSGSEASFEGSGGIVNVSTDVAVSNLTFTGNGYTLMGAGRLSVEGTLSVYSATTNSVAAQIITGDGLSKTGAGALSLARCAGVLAVQEGTLLVSGTLFADADVSVAAGASLITLGEPDAAANLIANPGFEDPSLANGAWAYRDIPNWTRSASASNVGMKNTAAAGEWALTGASPEGVQMAIVQGGGALSQTVTVSTDGLYAVAFSYILRNRAPARTNQVYISLGGVPLAAFVNRAPPTAARRFDSGAIWLSTGTYTLTFAGEIDHGWSDCTTLLDAVRFAPPSDAEPCHVLGGDSTLTLVTGASAVLSHSGTSEATLVTIDGTSVPGGFTYDSSHASGIFSGSGSLAAQPPENVFAQADSGNWSATATWQSGSAPAAGGDADLLLRLSADSNNDLAGNFQTKRIQLFGTGTAALSGNAITLADSISQPLPGDWTISAPVTAASAFTVDNTGDLTFTQPISLANNALFVKSGSGTLTLAAFTNGFNTAYIYRGTVSLPSLPATPASWALYSSTDCPAALRFTAPGSVTPRINMYGSGLPVIAVNAGGTVTLSDWTVAFGNNAAFDVADGDTLSLRQLLRSRLSNGMASAPMLLKTGPGTLEIRSAGADDENSRAYPGSTILRNGTLLLSEDDYGTLNNWTNPFNGRTYDGKGGSLGYNDLSNDMIIGDAGTELGDDLAIIAAGDGRWIGHDIEVMNAGSTVTLGMTEGTTMFGGTLTIHRDIMLDGPSDGIIVFSDIIFAPDFNGTGVPVLSGLSKLVFEGTVPDELSLLLGGRSLSFGTFAARQQTLNALVIGSAATSATLDVDFAPGINDRLDTTMTDGLTISNTVVNLFYADTGLPFYEAGIYTLFSYAGTLGGDISLLSVGNMQSGAGYTFSNDTANALVLLTISNTSGGTSAMWKKVDSGLWSLGSNWDGGSVPDAAGIKPLFGIAITNKATVTIDSASTVGGLTFNNSSYGYTLSGSSLNLDDGTSTPLISALTGAHTISTTLNGSSGVEISAGTGATLTLSTNTVVNTDLSLISGTVATRNNVAVNGALTGTSSSTFELTGTTPALTVNQSGNSTFSGTLAGVADGTLAKEGIGTLTLDNPFHTYEGLTKINAGTLALQSSALAGALEIAASSTLSVQTPVSDGLMGYYYSTTPNTNNYWTLSALEAHFASLTPDVVSPSGLQGSDFDFGWNETCSFPQPYGAGGSRTEYFEVVWRGTITIPQSGVYMFGVYCDDGFLLAIDSQTVNNRNYNLGGWSEASIRLNAGSHDIVLGYFQIIDSVGLRMQVTQPGTTTAMTVPNSWFTPYSAVGTLSGSGELDLTAADAELQVNQDADSTFAGTLTGPTGSLLAKSGSGFLFLTGNAGAANGFSGDIDVQGGSVALTADNRISNGSTLRVHSDATLAVSGEETVAAIQGDGTLALGGYAYVKAFTGDADSGISIAKTYTHLMDFPLSTANPTVNGVTFDDRGSYTGTLPGGAWNSATGDATLTGMESLLYDFNYGSYNFTFTLTGLTAGETYVTRFYFKNWADNPREVVFTFFNENGTIDTIQHNPDSVTRSIVGCQYTADNSGELSIRIKSLNDGHSCHLYGLSNESVPGASSGSLTLAPASGTVASFIGAITGIGTLTKQGAGTQSFGGANTLSLPLEIEAGTAVLESGASVASGVSVASGATLQASSGNVTLGGIIGEGSFNLGNTPTNTGPYFVAITSDADCDISTDKDYTHLLDFGSNANKAIVNGVAFTKTTATSGSINGYGWSGMPTSYHNGSNASSIGVATDQDIYNLIYDMNYGLRDGTMKLTGLTVGRMYEIRLYNRRWEPDFKDREQTFTFDPDGTGPISDVITFNPDDNTVTPNDNYLGYRYLAATNELAIIIDSHNENDTYHLYGLSNEETVDALANPVTLDIAGNNVFDGTVTGLGALVKSGTGTLTFTGENTANGAIAVNAGAFGVAGGGNATDGPVTVAAGATLFGDGRIGGSVTVVSNAFMHAGTADACGTLQIGGYLMINPGALPYWRFESGASDTTTVNGILIFPTNGVLQVESLTTGLMPPAKGTVYASTQSIVGPDDLTGWSIEGATHSTLIYNEDRTKIYFNRPSGTLLMIR